MKVKNLRAIFPLVIFFVSTTAYGETTYGANEKAGSYLKINGVNLYYESYGTGEPLLLIHPNGVSLSSMSHQITHFQKHYRVIAMDSRGHGKSEIGKAPLTYRQIARDIASLVSTLALENVKVIGFSDGAIVGLILGVEHPQLFEKMALMSPNTRPDNGAIDPVLIEYSKAELLSVEEKIAANDKSKDWQRIKQQKMLTMFQPDISVKELASIKTPILLMAGDRDLITNFHMVEIFENLPNAHLAIFPNETHFTPVTNPTLFNTHVDKFFNAEFYRTNSFEAFSQLNQ